MFPERNLIRIFCRFQNVSRIAFSKRCSTSYTGFLRSDLCGTLTSQYLNKEVSVCGWLHRKRLDNRFWLVRDWSGIVQVVIEDDERKKMVTFSDVPLESVVQIRGVLQRRPKDQENPDMATGQMEIKAEHVQILNPALPNLPFTPINRNVNEAIRLQFRYLDLRTLQMQRHLRLRSSVTSKMRHFLQDRHRFVDVETPYLFRQTPGGAREFLVPSSQSPGKFYALTQSPQQFKQLLMIGGIDRYFQIARCFRDESNNPEKQPEFTQLDLEMSFVNMESIMKLIEDLIVFSWPEEQGPSPSCPFPRMKYDDAMRLYGSDKPDLRFGMQFTDVSAFAQRTGLFGRRSTGGTGTCTFAFVAPGAAEVCKTAFKKATEGIIKREFVDVATMFMQAEGEELFKPSKLSREAQGELYSALSCKPGDLVVICAGDEEACQKALGRMRLETANHLEISGTSVRQPGFHFSWVVDFPLFSRSSTSPDSSWESVHHPFTAPLKEDEHLLHDQQPLSAIRSQHYDLVLNGAEVGGGSIRVHNATMQEHILSLLKISSNELKHLLVALESGCPPHGGIALGLDRLICIYAEAKSIRDVIAFPKSATGRDIMSSAPCAVPKEQLDFYHISVNNSAKDSVDVVGCGIVDERTKKQVKGTG